jgi:hypothetical protein
MNGNVYTAAAQPPQPAYPRQLEKRAAGRVLAHPRDDRPGGAVADVWSSGGGIRTRDLRVMRSPQGGQVGRDGDVCRG